MTSRWITALPVVLLMLAAPAVANAAITVTRGQFTDRVDHNLPVGDAASLANVRTAIYWFELANDTHAAGEVTLIWSVNGRETFRQRMVVNPTRTMRTWAFLPLHHSTHEIRVRIVAADGTTELHTDSTTLANGGGNAAAPTAAAPAPTAPAPTAPAPTAPSAPAAAPTEAH